jgi:hypothetical protein
MHTKGIISARNGDGGLFAWSIILFFACVVGEFARIWREEEDAKDKEHFCDDSESGAPP